MGSKSLNSLGSFIFDKGITFATFQTMGKIFPVKQQFTICTIGLLIPAQNYCLQT